eukprot:scaffold63671_cov40-Prasinocladus_malaysianus.AAC.1
MLHASKIYERKPSSVVTRRPYRTNRWALLLVSMLNLRSIATTSTRTVGEDVLVVFDFKHKDVSSLLPIYIQCPIHDPRLYIQNSEQHIQKHHVLALTFNVCNNVAYRMVEYNDVYFRHSVFYGDLTSTG